MSQESWHTFLIVIAIALTMVGIILVSGCVQLRELPRVAPMTSHG